MTGGRGAQEEEEEEGIGGWKSDFLKFILFFF